MPARTLEACASPHQIDHGGIRTEIAQRWAWRVYLVGGLVALGVYEMVPRGIANDGLYVLLGGSCIAAIALGVVIHRPHQRLPWLLMALGQLLWVFGDVVDSWYQDVSHVQVYPSLADAFYLSAYPVLAVGLLLLIRGRRPKRDVAGLLDSYTLTAGLALLSWVLLARPTLGASHYSVAAAAVGVAYPVADILLVGMLIRLVMTPGGRTTAFRLLLGAVALLIAGDTTSAALGLWTSTTSDSFNVIWLASYIAWGTAALHPSMTRLSEPSTGEEFRFTRIRVCALGGAALIAPGILAAQRLAGATVDVWPVVAGSVIVFLLVVGRMNVAISQLVAANRERDLLQTRLAYQAAHDSLTDLPNRAQALEGIEAALGRAQRAGTMCGLLFVDLDGFKSVNDTHGHAAGDDVLRATAHRLQSTVRVGDLVSRLGGDEFVVLLENLEAETEALEVAHRLIHDLSTPTVLGSGHTVRVGASIGMAISQDGSVDAGRFLHEADTAVYRAKAAGRGRVNIFDDSLRRELEEQGDLEHAIRYAIEHDELLLHYQPIVDLATNQVSGHEALVRWDRPGHGLLQPAQFIPAAEATTLICDLDRWVLHHAAAQVAEWNRAGEPTTIAVNISCRHISLPRVLDDVADALAASGLAADRLVLEITETVLDDDLLATRHCQRLRELGVAISIDDWGTGYNSLGRLQQLPVDIIKIDRTFLDTSQQPNRVLLELMIQAAHAFGLPVVVEGVEQQDQLDLLRFMECESAQGFFLARPLAPDQAVRSRERAAL